MAVGKGVTYNKYAFLAKAPKLVVSIKKVLIN